jgi:hypothetical protein
MERERERDAHGRNAFTFPSRSLVADLLPARRLAGWGRYLMWAWTGWAGRPYVFTDMFALSLSLSLSLRSLTHARTHARTHAYAR